MSNKEGVIKYELNYNQISTNEITNIKEINVWRKKFYQRKLIGQEPNRYDGMGFGNVSRRLTVKEKNNCHGEFVITGTQTGHLPELDIKTYTVITQYDTTQNKISAIGSVKPSSEALTHAAIYQANKDIQFVFHVHSPEIWNNAQRLKIAETEESILYGTPAMANEITRLLLCIESENYIFSMKGHTDGIISCGKSAEEAGNLLIDYYDHAQQLYSRKLSMTEC